ncbi:hypothetical protein HID58_033415 [Brassica napus]|uniref:Uncharacterized protein n=1 Tax=Brassica napus TaxID=3708 RepID=A0ABQ8BZC2_BRANA|nr:hypothetical protein HID58_033415 [Brassica napus]
MKPIQRHRNSALFICTIHRISGDVNASDESEAESTNPCVNKAKALPLKIISIIAILLTSMIGVSAPLFSRDVPFLHPDENIFTSTSEISDPSMGTSFMHFLPDSFQMLSSECLEDDPWQKFPFTGFHMLPWLPLKAATVCRYLVGTSHSAIMATSFYSSKTGSEIVPAAGNGDQERANPIIAHGHSHGHGVTLTTKDDSDSQLLGISFPYVCANTYRQVLELGTIVHSVVIALSLGATNDTCTIKVLQIFVFTKCLKALVLVAASSRSTNGIEIMV